ncbi:MAG: hypothetical protein FJ271_29410 [Planctomycetes bacterium]|nr:hypothetical protein [Planctomycetota bacterium]
MKRFAIFSAVIVLFITDQGYAGPRRLLYPVYYPYYPRVIIAPVIIRPVSPVLPGNYYGAFIPGNAAPAVPQAERYVRLENKTGERLAVSMLCRTRDEQGRWTWLPEGPSGDRAMNLVLEPGKVLDLTGKISASRIRIWAESASRKWVDYQAKDLLLLPEAEGMYLSSRVETFTYVFDKK